jgi:hypothetical protein
MQPGYKHLDLRNGFNKVGIATHSPQFLTPLLLFQPLGPTLFVHIEVQDYVSDAHKELVSALQNPIKAVAQRECELWGRRRRHFNNLDGFK